jgi:hypothetical protein
VVSGGSVGRKVKHVTFEKIKEFARAKGGECLNETYENVNTKIRFRCCNNHEWETGIYAVYGKTWCASCYHLRSRTSVKLPIEEIEQRLTEKGYRALEGVPTRVDKKTMLEHSCGTKVFTTVKNVKKGNPCPLCNGSLSCTKEACEEYVQAKGGKLVSWAGTKATRTVFECNKQHIWNTSWKAMKQHQSWCPVCANANKFKKISDKPDMVKARKQLNGYLSRDQKTGKDFDIDVDFILDARSKPCHYCARQATGLDRIDNSLGHLKINCVPACIRCNWIRGNYLSFEVMEKVGKLLQEIDP